MLIRDKKLAANMAAILFFLGFLILAINISRFLFWAEDSFMVATENGPFLVNPLTDANVCISLDERLLNTDTQTHIFDTTEIFLKEFYEDYNVILDRSLLGDCPLATTYHLIVFRDHVSAISALKNKYPEKYNIDSGVHINEPALTRISFYNDQAFSYTSIKSQYFNFGDSKSIRVFSSILIQEIFHSFSFGKDVVDINEVRFDSILNEKPIESESVNTILNSEELIIELYGKNSECLSFYDYVALSFISSRSESVVKFDLYERFLLSSQYLKNFIIRNKYKEFKGLCLNP